MFVLVSYFGGSVHFLYRIRIFGKSWKYSGSQTYSFEKIVQTCLRSLVMN